jgi:hypothetical protein
VGGQVSETTDGRGSSKTDQNCETVVGSSQLRPHPSVEQVSETENGQGNSRTVGPRQHGGHNREQVMMNIKTFKNMCMKANTKRASDIHDYYITMEETLQEYINETYIQRHEQMLLEQRLNRERILVEKYHKCPVNYLLSGIIDNEPLGRYGWTNDIKTRIAEHKQRLGKSFILDCLVECEKNTEIEKCFEKAFASRRITKHVNGRNHIELVKLDDLFGPNEVTEYSNSSLKTSHTYNTKNV